MTGTWATGWATNDIVTAAEFKKSAGSISDTTLGVSAASIDITGISATYAHLMISVYARGDIVNTLVAVQMRFNGDTGANYDYQLMQGQAAAASAAESFAQTSGQVGYATASTGTANVFGTQEVFIPHYAGSTNNKQYVSLSALKYGTATTNLAVNLIGGSWRSNAAINQVTILPLTGNFVSGTRVTIHALGA